MSAPPPPPSAGSPGHELVVEFAGEERRLQPSETLTFGRAADLVLDENPNLHRVLGRFSWANGMWWLANVGTVIPISLGDETSTSVLKVGPGSAVALSFDQARLNFEAGGTAYELRIDQLADVPALEDTVVLPEAEETRMPTSIPLTDEQRLLLVALAEHELRDLPSREGMATNRQVAAKLGWTITKFNRKLDRLCRRYASAGVSGLRGDSAALARDRRVRLVEYVLHAGIINADDLALLDEATQRP